MIDLMNRITTVLDNLADYKHVNLENLYNDKNLTELFEVLDSCLDRGYPLRHDMELLQELHDEIDSFIQWETNYNATIGSF